MFKLVSRDIPALQGCTRVRLDPDNDKKVVGDIELFVSARIEELSGIERFNNDIQASVQTALLERDELCDLADVKAKDNCGRTAI